MVNESWTNTEGSQKWQEFCKRLENMIPDLQAEFLNNQPDVVSRVQENDIVNVYGLKPGPQKKYYNEGWTSLMLRYPVDGVEDEMAVIDTKYPIAASLIREFEPDVCLALYSCLAPRSSIPEHSDIENPEHQFIRIHIPLFIPKGDVYFTVGNRKLTWDNGVFGFDGGVHSAHNNTDDWRVILLIDIQRDNLDL